MPQRDVKVRWELASDENFSEITRSGTFTATPEFAHSVHVEAGGLEPGRFYWYRFKAGDEISPTGRTKTAPSPDVSLSAMAFAFASCQYWEEGYYPAYRASQEDLDFVVHLGDYIYEWAPMSGRPRMHETPAPATLDGYRDRYALYKTDPDLQAAHAAHPWVVTWDDHEGQNNYVGLLDEESRPTTKAFIDREAAYQAYYEHMPLRRSSLPQGAGMRKGGRSVNQRNQNRYVDITFVFGGLTVGLGLALLRVLLAWDLTGTLREKLSSFKLPLRFEGYHRLQHRITG